MFYSVVGAEKLPEAFVLAQAGMVLFQRIKTDLYPVLRYGDKFDFNIIKAEVESGLSEIFTPTKEEIIFWREFTKSVYRPELVFNGEELQRIKTYPMASWKCRNIRKNHVTKHHFTNSPNCFTNFKNRLF